MNLFSYRADYKKLLAVPGRKIPPAPQFRHSIAFTALARATLRMIKLTYTKPVNAGRFNELVQEIASVKARLDILLINAGQMRPNDERLASFIPRKATQTFERLAEIVKSEREYNYYVGDPIDIWILNNNNPVRSQGVGGPRNQMNYNWISTAVDFYELCFGKPAGAGNGPALKFAKAYIETAKKLHDSACDQALKEDQAWFELNCGSVEGVYQQGSDDLVHLPDIKGCQVIDVLTFNIPRPHHAPAVEAAWPPLDEDKFRKIFVNHLELRGKDGDRTAATALQPMVKPETILPLPSIGRRATSKIARSSQLESETPYCT